MDIKNPVITSKALRPAVSEAQIETFEGDPYPNIQARPLQMPEFTDVKPVNPMHSLRWVDRVAGNGQRFDQMKYAGFTVCKPEEARMRNNMPIEASMIKDTQVIYGSLILMKIDRKLYEGALKYNWVRSVNRLHPKAQLQAGKAKLNEAIKESGAARIPDLAKKLQAFRPSDAEVIKAEAEEDGVLPT
jgi:hypothetical protein